MKFSPLSLGVIHFVGIGGIGLSGMAEILHNMGQEVQGSDLALNANILRLKNLGIKVFEGHKGDHVRQARFVVISSAVKPDNPEVVEARKLNIPVVSRAEMLAGIMRLKWSIAITGTHGKTTTTSLIATLLQAANLDPTIINGGIINSLSSNACLGTGDWMVVETDESDGTFTKVPATIAVVTNIDPEHLDYYGSFEVLRDNFKTFLKQIPFYGFAVACIDHPVVKSVVQEISDRQIITYGFDETADVRAIDVKPSHLGMTFTVLINHQKNGRTQALKITDIYLPMFGMHNVQNCLAAIAIASELEIGTTTLIEALKNFSGVKRRFTQTGVVDGVTIIDDYGHHPVEINAVLKAARNFSNGKVIAILQPHRYSRVSNLFNEFTECTKMADVVAIAPIYPAGERPIEGITHFKLAEGMREKGHREVSAIEGREDLVPFILAHSNPGDCVVFLGAGNITEWAHAMPEELERVKLKKKCGS